LAELNASGRDHLHPTDRDARMMLGSEGLGFSYNAQAVVDGSGGLIVAEDVHTDESDNELLVPMVEEVRGHLGEWAAETLADGGYYSPQQLAEAESRGLEVLVKMPPVGRRESGRSAVPRAAFAYDAERDVYVCPAGEMLRFKTTRLNSHKKYRQRVYQCGQGRACRCGSGSGPRQVYRSAYHDVVERQRLKQAAPDKRALLGLRKTVAELPFALIKEHMGFRKFTVRGLDSVRTQWSLICTAFNLRALYRRWLAGELVLA
jgi:hypothetical protein